VTLYTQALEMYPESSHLYLSRAKAYYYNHDLKHAHDDLRIAVQKDPTNHEAAERLRSLSASFQAQSPTRQSGLPLASPQRTSPRRSERSVQFPQMPRKDSVAIKMLPGRSAGETVVPHSFGSGFQVMPKADARRARQTSNNMRTTRPLP